MNVLPLGYATSVASLLGISQAGGSVYAQLYSVHVIMTGFNATTFEIDDAGGITGTMKSNLRSLYGPYILGDRDERGNWTNSFVCELRGALEAWIADRHGEECVRYVRVHHKEVSE